MAASAGKLKRQVIVEIYFAKRLVAATDLLLKNSRSANPIQSVWVSGWVFAYLCWMLGVFCLLGALFVIFYIFPNLRKSKNPPGIGLRSQINPG